MNISKDHVVTLGYELHSSTNKGERVLVEVTTPETPFVFIFGSGGLIPSFEANLLGKVAGDTFEFDIDSADAYGPFDIDSVVDIPKEAFAGGDISMILPGKMIPMTDDQGHHLNGKVLELKENSIVMDFNHPLAGKDLHFKGKIANVRASTKEELEHGHVHGPGGHHH